MDNTTTPGFAGNCGQSANSADNLRTSEALIESSPDWQRARMLGRREALDIIIEQSAEDFPDDFQRSRPLGDTGDFMTEWKVEKLEELLDAKEPSSLIERLDSRRWEMAFELSQITKERDAARTEIEAMREVLKEAHKIIEVLYMDALDSHKESWPRANEWMQRHATFADHQPNTPGA